MANGSNKQIIQIGGGGGGSGDVVGPASSTDNAITRFDTTTGKIIQNSGVTIDDTGRVGVGNSGVAQSYLVDVNNSTGEALLRVKDTDSTYQGVVLSSDTNGGYVTNSNIGTSIGEGIYLQNSAQAMRFYTAGTEKARIDSTGKFGIGVTPSATLDVVGSTSGDLLVQAQNTNANGISSFVAKDNGGTRFLTFGVNNTTMNLGTQYGIAGEGVIRSSGSATGIAVSASSGPIRFLQTAGGSERMRIDTGGNVGIGNILPSFNLDVTGTARFGNATFGVDFESGTMRLIGTGPRIIYSGGYSSQIQIDGSSVTLNSNSGGRTGVGVVTPTAALHIKAGSGTANTSPLKFNSGVNLTTIEDGAVEYDGTHLYVSIGGVRYQIDQQAVSIPSTAISDFASASRAQTEAELVAGANITITPSGTGATRQLTIASTGGGGGTMTVQDEGSTTSTTVTTLNFTGAGVTASGGGATATINIPGGGGGTTKGIAEVDFGVITQENDTAIVTVSTASITTTSYPSVTMYAIATTDHDPDDYVAEGLTAYISNIINGVSFDIMVNAPNLTWGKYKVTYLY